MTPRAEETRVGLASWMPFESAQEVLEDLLGVRVSKATVRRATLASGEAALAVCEREQERLKQEVPLAPEGADKQAMSGDGAFVLLVGGEWVEVKTLTIGEVTHNAHGEVCLEQFSSFSRLADAARFAEAAVVETYRRGMERATAVCAVQDGAQWLQGLVDYQRADAVRILDFAHGAEYIHAIGQAVQAAGGRLPSRWLEGVLHRLKHQGPQRVLTHLNWLGARYPSPIVQEKLSYLHKREAHRQYHLSASRLAHWFGQRGKRQQGGRRSTAQRGWHALGSTERQSHAGAPQRGLQSAVEPDLGDSGGSSTSVAHKPSASREPAAPDQRLLDARLLGSAGVSAVSPACSDFHRTSGCSQGGAPASSPWRWLLLAQTFSQTPTFHLCASRGGLCKKMKRTPATRARELLLGRCSREEKVQSLSRMIGEMASSSSKRRSTRPMKQGHDEMTHGSEDMRCIPSPNAAMVFSKRHITHVMQAVLNAPMSSYQVE